MAGSESPRGENRFPLQGRGAKRATQAPTPRSPAFPFSKGEFKPSKRLPCPLSAADTRPRGWERRFQGCGRRRSDHTLLDRRSDTVRSTADREKGVRQPARRLGSGGDCRLDRSPADCGVPLRGSVCRTFSVLSSERRSPVFPLLSTCFDDEAAHPAGAGEDAAGLALFLKDHAAG